MGLGDLIAGSMAPTLARRQAAKLADARQQALARDPDLPTREYQRAREGLLGRRFGLLPAGTARRTCMVNDKATRRRQRLDLVSGSLVACPEHVVEAVRLRQDMDEVEHARLAKHVYLKHDPDAPADLLTAPPGFLDATDDELDQLGLKAVDLAPKGSAFRAAVYRKDPAVWDGDAVPAFRVVFRGSTLALEDWQNNFAQNADEASSYYERAVTMGNSIAKSGSRGNVHIVGHSLGGGLASAAQGGSGSTTTTFNAAGLHPRTVARYSQVADRRQAEPHQIVAYQVEGEVLTATQESGVASLFANPAVGRRAIVPPARPEVSADDRHAMDEVIDAIEARKTRDEATLQACLDAKAPPPP